MADTLSEKAAQALEWSKVLECGAQGAQSALGAARCRVMALDKDLEVLVRRHQETTEWLRLSEGSDPLPVLSFPDARELVERAGKGGVLEALVNSIAGVIRAVVPAILAYAVGKGWIPESVVAVITAEAVAVAAAVWLVVTNWKPPAA